MRKLISKCLAVVLVLSCITIGFTSCGSKEETSMIDKIKESGTLVMGTASGYPPYEFVSTADGGDVIGIDVELGQAIADKLGVSLKVVDMPFGELIAALSTGKCDVAIAGMPETEEKAKSVDFSSVYINDEQSIVVRTADLEQYKSLSDLADKTIGVEKGSSCEEVAKAELPNANMVSLAKVPDVFLELKNNKIDAIVIAKVVATQYIVSDSTVSFANDTVILENKDKPCQAAVAKDNEEFLALVDEVIEENQDNGNFDDWILEYCEKANAQGSDN